MPVLFPVPGLCRLSGCFFIAYSIASWLVIICYGVLCSIALYYNMLFDIYYVLCMRFFISCYLSLRMFWLLCYVMVSIMLWFALFGYVLFLCYFNWFGYILLCFDILYYIPLYREIPYT